MSSFDTGCLVAMFLVLTCMVATLAVRSIWKFRHEPPLTPLRIGLLLLLINGSSLLSVLLREDWFLLVVMAGVFFASVSWLIAWGM